VFQVCRNVARIKELRPHLNGEYFLILDSSQQLKLSRSYKNQGETAALIESGGAPRPLRVALAALLQPLALCRSTGKRCKRHSRDHGASQIVLSR
jgi:hypothetical protein